MNLRFVTANPAKLADYRPRFARAGIELAAGEVALVEPQSLDLERIVRFKLEQAIARFPREQVLVEDRAFFVDALSGFPGPLVKPILETIGVRGVLKLLDGETNRSARFSFAVAWSDGQVRRVFVGEEQGSIPESPRGTILRGWSDLVTIFVNPAFPTKTLAELDDAEWREYSALVERTDAVSQLLAHLAQEGKT